MDTGLTMIDHEDKFIFIHIGKTGGSSIEKALNPDVTLDGSARTAHTGNTDFLEKHWNAQKYQREYKDFFESYFKFSFVRNPWDREVSRWKWFSLARGDNHSFSKHVTSHISNCQSDWLCTGDHYLTDFIGRFETLQEDFDVICDKMGRPRQKLPHINKTKRKHYTEYYDDETRQIVAEKYAKDIEYFNYKFQQ